MDSIDDSDEELTGNPEHDLQTFKDWIRDAEEYWNPNIMRFMYYMNFLCVSTIDKGDEVLLDDMNRPAMMFNQLDAVGCKLLGEFASQEPGIVVSAADGVMVDDDLANMIECVEAHMRYSLSHTNSGNAGNRTFKDEVYGGYGAMEVYTEYLPGSLKQCIKHQRLNPTMCGWDPMATEPHKGDGKFCYKKIYMTYESVKLKFGKEVANSISYVNGAGGSNTQAFSWSYQNTKQKVAVIVEMYVKKERRGRLVLLSNGEEMDEKQYKQNLKDWDKSGIMLPPPTVTDSRAEIFTDILRYTLCESKIIEVEVDGKMQKYEETIFEMLPIVFFDGNSAEVQTEKGGCLQQVTRPYFYNARDAQKFKDFAGQSFAGELQSTIQSKIIVAEESIPKQYLDNYLNPQHNSVLPYKTMYKDDPNHPNPPPTIIHRPDIPQSIPAAFYGADKLIQTTLGNYDTQLAMQPDVSGKAIQEGSMESDAAAKPYFDNFFEGQTRVAQIELNLIPKVYKTPRSIPITLKNGKKSYAIINSDDIKPKTTGKPDKDAIQNHAVYMNYKPSDLLVQVKSGPNSAVQKRAAVDQITKMMAASPEINGFFSGPAFEVLIDNWDFRGAERAKSMVPKYQEQQQQQAAQAKQMAEQMQQMQMQITQMQGLVLQAQANKFNADAHKAAADSVIENKRVDNEESMAVANLLLTREEKEAEFALKQEELAIKETEAAGKLLLSRQELSMGQVDQVLRASEISAERERTAAEHALAVSEHVHNVNIDMAGLKNESKEAESSQ